MSRRFFIAGNWKLNKGPSEARELAKALKATLGARTDLDIAVFPTTVSLAGVLDELSGSSVHVGIQEINHQTKGAYTGTNSPVMARELGCTYALIGHSERRQYYGETDEGVNKKTHAALAAGLLPIVCVGETLDERKGGQVEAVVGRQLRKALEGLEADQVATLTIAYEPVWAIGTGHNASVQQIEETHSFIQQHWQKCCSAAPAPILYGGSIKPDNFAEILALESVAGGLVGGASLKADSFCKLIAISEETTAAG